MFCFVSTCCVFHSVAEWTIPTVIGDIPPPMDDFSFTQISSHEAVLIGGKGLGYRYFSDFRLATVRRDSVVSV